jgi:hypothetical protein
MSVLKVSENGLVTKDSSPLSANINQAINPAYYGKSQSSSAIFGAGFGTIAIVIGVGIWLWLRSKREK